MIHGLQLYYHKVGRRAHFIGIRVDWHPDDRQIAPKAPQAASSTC